MSSLLARAWVSVRETVSEAAHEASVDSVPMMAAAISYYLLVTIAPLLFALAVLASAIRVAAGVPVTSGGSSLDEVLAGYSSSAGTAVAVIALAMLLFGASGVFSQFVLAISRIWKEPVQRGPLFSFARRHAIAFVLLLVLAMGMLSSLLIGGVVSAITVRFAAVAASVGFDVQFIRTLAGGRFLYDFVAAFLLFTAAFSLVPVRKVGARDVAPGAAITAAAYAAGQIGLNYYLAHTSRVTLYAGMAGLVVVLLWAYYSALIALYGAELTKAIVLRRERTLSGG